MLNNIKILAVTLSALSSVTCSDSGKIHSFDDDSRAIEKIFNDVDISRKYLPKIVDRYSTLEEIDFNGSTMTFSYRLEVSNLNENTRNLIESEILKKQINVLCMSSDIDQNLTIGIDYDYIYYDVDNVLIGNFDITRSICDKLK